MATPKGKVSKARRDSRRSAHWKLSLPGIVKCPKCGNDDDKVLDSRASKEGVVIRRRRECLKCGFRFTTHEEIDREDLFVVKRDGRREVFQREKLEKSVRIACQKRPIPESKVQDLIGGVVAALEGEEVPAEQIGQ